MRALVLRLLALLGLAPASHVRHAQARAQRAATTIARLERQLAAVRGDVDTWKRRHQEATAAAAKWKTVAGGAEDDARQAKAETERARAQVDEWRGRAEVLIAERRALREHLDESRRVAAIAREQFMATEVKLDLVEATIHVRDGRTRKMTVSR